MREFGDESSANSKSTQGSKKSSHSRRIFRVRTWKKILKEWKHLKGPFTGSILTSTSRLTAASSTPSWCVKEKLWDDALPGLDDYLI